MRYLFEYEIKEYKQKNELRLNENEKVVYGKNKYKDSEIIQ